MVLPGGASWTQEAADAAPEAGEDSSWKQLVRHDDILQFNV